MIEFLNKDDEKMRLDRTICKWAGDNVLIKTDFGLPLNTVFAKRLKKGSRTVEVDCSDVRFDARAPSLGWFESAGGVWWLTRAPRRQFKGGLPTRNSVVAKRIGDNEQMNMPEHWIVSPEMDRSLIGYDREFDEAVQECLESGYMMAVVNKDFAISIRDGVVVELYYCGRFVGYMEGGQPRLFNGPDASFILRAMHRVKGF